MTKLERLYTEQRQSPWLDNLTPGIPARRHLGRLRRQWDTWVTANPTILAKAIQASDLYDAQFLALTAAGCSVEDAYWDLAVHDVTDALAVLRPTYDKS
jgi:transaldolase